MSLVLSSPVGASIGDGHGIGTIINDDLPVLSIASTSVVEGTGQSVAATLVVSLSAPTVQTVRATIATAGGSAVSGVDFEPVRRS